MKKLIKNLANHEQVVKRPYIKQFVKFAIIGAGNTFLHLGVYLGLTRSSEYWNEHYLWANLVAFVVSASSSYILNKNWTFKDKSKRIHIQYPKFIAVSSIGLLINETILYLLVTHFEFYDLIAMAIAIGVVLFWNFVINRLWTFRPQEKNENKKLQNTEL